MVNSVIVRGPDGPLKSAIQRRLASLPPISDKDENDIEIGVGTEAQDLSILKYEQERNNASPCIILKDVVTDVEDNFWSDGLFHSVIRDAISGKSDSGYPSNPRYWLPVENVADAIRTLVSSNVYPSSSKPILMTGRRPWRCEALLMEASHLWARFQASNLGEHSPETLSEPPLHLSDKTDVTVRPDLSELNDLMLSCGEPYGWRPPGSLRLSIMRVFATLV